MNLREWDQQIGPRLNDLTHYGTWMALYASNMLIAAQNLPARPAWETMARDALNQAERDLRAALGAVQEAQRRYDTAPIIIDAYSTNRSEHANL